LHESDYIKLLEFPYSEIQHRRLSRGKASLNIGYNKTCVSEVLAKRCSMCKTVQNKNQSYCSLKLSFYY